MASIPVDQNFINLMERAANYALAMVITHQAESRIVALQADAADLKHLANLARSKLMKEVI